MIVVRIRVNHRDARSGINDMGFIPNKLNKEDIKMCITWGFL